MGKFWNLKQTVALLLLFFPATLFYALQNRDFEQVPVGFLRPPAHFIQEGYDQVTYVISSTVSTYLNLIDIKKENTQLKAQIAHLATQTQLVEEYRSENSRLKTLLNFKKELERKNLAARVISKDVLLDHKSILINKGAKDGIKKLQAVVSPEGVVGYIIAVEENSSRILLLTDRSANIDATIQRTRARGIVSGISRSKCRLKYIMRKEDVAEGDIIVTSGRQGYFPKGFIVGSVLDVEESPAGASYHAKVKPAAPIDKLEEVFVILENKPAKETASQWKRAWFH